MSNADTRAPTHRLVGWQRRALYATGVSLLLTGCVWLAVHYSVGAGAGELPHPLEAWSLRLHGLAAFGSLFVLGLLAADHVPRGWRLCRPHDRARQRRGGAHQRHGEPQPRHDGSHRRHDGARQRSSGALLCALAALLAGSGYLLFYFAPEAVRPALGWVHASIGGIAGVLLAVHRRGVGGRTRRSDMS